MVTENNIDFIKLYTQPPYDSYIKKEQHDFANFDLDFAYLMFIGESYKINGFLYYNLMSSQKLNILEHRYRDFLTVKYQEIYNKNGILINELTKISNIDVDFVLLKGIALIQSIYKNMGIRQMNDIDLLCSRKDSVRVVKALNDMGYIQGEYDTKRNIIIRSTKKEEYKSKMYSHELIRFVKVIDGHPINIDINVEFSWRHPFVNEDRIVFEDIISECRPLESLKHCYLMKPELNLLHICRHIFNESYFHLFTNKRLIRELSLYRFCDVINIAKMNMLEWNHFLDFAKKYNYQKSAWYALSLTNIIWLGSIPHDVVIELFSSGYSLDDYCQLDGTITRWQTSPFERVFDIYSKQ